MREITLFAEDAAHERIVGAFLRRLAKCIGIEINVRTLNATGGHGRVLAALGRFVRDVERRQIAMPDMIVVGIDANCFGFNTRKTQIEKQFADFSIPAAYAIPDPHVERWLLVDAAAFKAQFGVGCAAPTQKCKRDLYKNLLREAIKKVGVTPLLGGIEYADDIIGHIDLTRRQPDPSLEKFLDPARRRFRQWAKTP